MTSKFRNKYYKRFSLNQSPTRLVFVGFWSSLSTRSNYPTLQKITEFWKDSESKNLHKMDTLLESHNEKH